MTRLLFGGGRYRLQYKRLRLYYKLQHGVDSHVVVISDHSQVAIIPL